MVANVMACLTIAGILERTGPRRGSILRVNPRFLDHLDHTRMRLLPERRLTDRFEALELALRTWDAYHGDPGQGAVFLDGFLADRHQGTNLIHPVFPPLELFPAAPEVLQIAA